MIRPASYFNSLANTLAIACFLFAPGCGNSDTTGAATPTTTVLARVSWSASDAVPHAPDRAHFERLAKDAMGSMPALPPAMGAGRILLNGTLESVDGRGTLILEARVKAPGLKLPVYTGIAASGSLSSNTDAEALVRQGLADAAAGVRAMILVLGLDHRGWTRALDSAEPDEQILAARLLARDKVRAAVPAIARLLAEPREQVAEAAAEALAAIGDESAVPLIIGSIKRGILRSEVRAIETLALIGGSEAEAYLEMTALGHEVEEVRHVSAGALEQLRSGKRRD